MTDFSLEFDVANSRFNRLLWTWSPHEPPPQASQVSKLRPVSFSVHLPAGEVCSSGTSRP